MASTNAVEQNWPPPPGPSRQRSGRQWAWPSDHLKPPRPAARRALLAAGSAARALREGEGAAKHARPQMEEALPIPVLYAR
eukprot:CAMPEP_0175282044 /NCGR_PEP_ID=MMETSP0093-20121207/51427_1 /TAXON_ID=311494 /ORGANISM="Alexandrium monilatum, Strain CCMP3105" /LENGTH=80 /DNA_ID=CAMNT_0016577231 /DNA_START=46 /DNA_END=285 /DNA_ORIENTATION=-